MSVSGEKSRIGRLTFSDQITSRLHRWVQKTTTKGRDKENAEKGSNIGNLSREIDHVKDNNLNINQCSPPPPRESKLLIQSNSDTRTILELEKALQDLINNCVTNAASSPNASRIGDGLQRTMTKQNQIIGENDGVGSNRGETTGDDDIADVGCQTRRGMRGRNVDEVMAVSGFEENREHSNASCEIMSVGYPTGEKLAIGQISPTSSRRNQAKVSHSETNTSKRKELHDLSPLSRTESHENAADRNHPSSSGVEVVNEDMSVCNTNNGLTSSGSSMKEQLRRISKSGWNVLHSGKQPKTLDGNGRRSSPKQRPPLRRIQSEGDTLLRRFSCNDSEVSEFAETCIRHAQRKCLSHANSLDSDADSLSDMIFGEAGQQASKRHEFAAPRSLALHSSARDSGNMSDSDPGSPASRSSDQDALPGEQHALLSDRPCSPSDVDTGLQASKLSPQCGVPGKHRRRSCTRDSGNGSDFDPGSPDIIASKPSDQHALRTMQHTSLCDRPSSLSFPLEKSKAKNVNKQSFFKHKSKSKATSEGSLSTQSPQRAAMSPKFKKFPYQPVFYVPQPHESSAPLAIPSKKNRSRSLTESEQGNSEHLI